jgi:hypothetical protein
MQINRLRAAAATAIGTAALAGAMSVAPVAANADSVGGYPCGLSTWVDGDNWYAIANCNYFSVNRRIIKSGGSRGSCRFIDSRSWVVGDSSLQIIGYEGC